MQAAILNDAPQNDWPDFFQAQRQWLAAVVFARVRDQHAVDEVLQNTALAASKSLPAVGDPQGRSKWLYRVAIRQAILYRRNQQRQKTRIEHAARNGHSSFDSAQADPHDLVVALEQHDLVRRAMQTLAARDYEILVLRYTHGWTVSEICGRLDVSASAVKSRLLRARRNLRRELLRLNQDWEVK